MIQAHVSIAICNLNLLFHCDFDTVNTSVSYFESSVKQKIMFQFAKLHFSTSYVLLYIYLCFFYLLIFLCTVDYCKKKVSKKNHNIDKFKTSVIPTLR